MPKTTKNLQLALFSLLLTAGCGGSDTGSEGGNDAATAIDGGGELGADGGGKPGVDGSVELDASSGNEDAGIDGGDSSAELEDSDSDGVADVQDAFPDDPSESTDSDKDGVGDNSDSDPDDPAACADSDGDGCDDCVNRSVDPADDGVDGDGDGLCDACGTTVCNGNGTCSLTDGSVVCNCDTGWSGADCEVDHDGCAAADSTDNNPCNTTDAAAICNDGAAPATGYTCGCTGGYTEAGGDCVELDACAAADGTDNNPCNTIDPSASCSDDAPPATSYTCNCSTGYHGSDCQTVYPSCWEILGAGLGEGDGLYLIDPDGIGGTNPFQVYCDMSTDGGGWTLLGVVSGGDADNWNTQLGYWSDANTLGTPSDIDSDHKSQAWMTLDLSDSEIRIEREYDGAIEAQSVLETSCLMGQSYFSDLFSATDTSRACLPGDVFTLRGSAVGVADASFREGSGAYALGGSNTNGFCWNGGDTTGNTFSGHILWNQYPGVADCVQGAHLGGIGVYANGDAQYTNADITGTNWLNGTDYTLTVIRFYARFAVEVTGALTSGDAGIWADGSRATSCAGYRFPGALPYVYRGSTESGVYSIDPDGAGGAPAYEVYCDMTTERGGWTLLGVVSGGDADNWNTQEGYWSDANLLGSAGDIDNDHKSEAWVSFDLSTAEILIERQYDGVVEAQSVLERSCLVEQNHFVDLFAGTDTSRACLPEDILTLRGSTVGVAGASFEEGAGGNALGAITTNGFCWNGGDTDTNTFSGHVVWNQYPDANDCLQVGHLGGIGVYSNGDAQYTNADITGTNWLNGTNYGLTIIRFYARSTIEITGALTKGDAGIWEDGTRGRSCDDYRHPDDYPYAYGGSTGDGIYSIDPDGVGGDAPYEVYCNMSADGGGWTLLGVVSGSDTDQWNTQQGYWSDANLLGDIGALYDDYKSEAWVSLDISTADILLERQYNGTVEAQSVLGNTCLMGDSRFTDLFAGTDTSRACLPGDIITLRGSAVGVAGVDYQEGSGASALGGSNTNGFCWNGGDTVSNTFSGHILWNQYPDANDCLQVGHLGGIGVYANGHAQYTNADITGTNWLNGTVYALTVIRFYAR